MRIQEGEFVFEMVVTHVVEDRVWMDVTLASAMDAYADTISLVTVAQWQSWVTGLGALLDGSALSYQSEFEGSRLAVLCEPEEQEWVLTIMIAPSVVLDKPSLMIGIDLENLMLDTSLKPTDAGKTLEVELVLSTDELRDFYTQIKEDYAIMVTNNNA